VWNFDVNFFVAIIDFWVKYVCDLMMKKIGNGENFDGMMSRQRTNMWTLLAFGTLSSFFLVVFSSLPTFLNIYTYYLFVLIQK